MDYKETSRERMHFQDLVQKFLLQQKDQVKLETQEKDSDIVHS